MGEHNVSKTLSGSHLRAFMRSLFNDLHALDRLISDNKIESGISRIGAEQEVFLVGRNWQPACVSPEILKIIDDPHFTTELSKFNIEINLDPLVLDRDCLRRMEEQLSRLLLKARQAAAGMNVEIALIGILPTVNKGDLALKNLTPGPRYIALNKALSELRGEPYEFHIRGQDELFLKHDSIMVESCNTSFQVHLQVEAEQFANLYNIAQVLAGPLLAAATNSPLLFGRRLWRETRIALFQQAVDTRNSNYYLRELSPRVTFGTQWVKSSVLEIYREDITRFRPLFDLDRHEDSLAHLAEGETPQLKALRMHNGTVYRWNRACYGVTDGKPHLRIENRVLPAGPTIVDEVANAALWLGMMRGCADQYRDITKQFAFEDAKMNFYNAARLGLQAQLTWLNGENIPAQQLLCHRLVPLAREGLQECGISSDDIDRYMSVIERRVCSGQTGSEWLLRSYAGTAGHGTYGERLNMLTAAVIKRQKEGHPVAEWTLANAEESGEWKQNYLKVEQYMTTDLFTVQEDEPLELVLSLMNWHRIRHVPVEDHARRLVGLVSYRNIMQLVADSWHDQEKETMAVADIMKRNPITVSPQTPTLTAIELMQKHRVSCLPVVFNDRLVGIITERDFIKITAGLLKEKLK